MIDERALILQLSEKKDSVALLAFIAESLVSVQRLLKEQNRMMKEREQ